MSTRRAFLTAAHPEGGDTGSGESGRAQPRGLRILLVEPHEETRLVLERALRRQHHHVFAAADAPGALAIADIHPLDIVISDLSLPDPGGPDLMQQLHSRFGLPGIAIRGFGEDEDVSKNDRSGFMHSITKPVSVQRLRELIAAVARSASDSRPDASRVPGRLA